MRRWIALAAAGGILCVAPLVLRKTGLPSMPQAGEVDDDPLAKAKGDPGFSKNVTPPPLTGVDLTRIRIDDDGASAPAHGGRTAVLTVEPSLQKFASRLLKTNGIPEAAVILTDTNTGKVLVYASHQEKGPARDLCTEATAPAASVFKIITASALVEQAGLSADTRQCYWGGEQRIDPINLVDDPKRDKWCATLAEAMGRSLNTVFARLASKHLDGKKLAAQAHAYGFGTDFAFDVPVAPSTLEVPDDPLGFARTSAGFWHSTLSPLEAAELAMTVANRGQGVKPYVVDKVVDETGVLYKAAVRTPLKRAVKPETADAVRTMMEATVRDGTSYKAFHDQAGKAFLPDITVAGKTGTLTRAETEQFYTWFVGFAPSKNPEVAVSVLVVNGPNWRVKANTVAREVLRAYFAAKDAPGVTMPKGVVQVATLDKD